MVEICSEMRWCSHESKGQYTSRQKRERKLFFW